MESIITCLKESGYDSLNVLQQDIRRMILDMIIDKGDSVSYDEIRCEGKRRGIDIKLINLTLLKFEEEHYFVAEDNEVVFMYPVSSKPTNHRVKLADGREFCAMCAIDSLGSAVTFDQDVTIDSKCMMTQKDIHVEVKDGKIANVNNQDIRVLHVNMDNYSNWAASC